MQDDASLYEAGQRRTPGPKGESAMAARKARAVAKAAAINRQQEIQRIWRMTVVSAVALFAVALAIIAL